MDEFSFISIVCTDIYGNAGGDWVSPIGDLLGQDGNICEDPLFCDPEGGVFTLAEGSPCLPEFNPDCGLIGAHGLGCNAPASAPPSEISVIGIQLLSNYPNPFNPVTTIHYELPYTQQARLTVYMVDGRRVVTLVDQVTPAGRQEIVWDGTDEHGHHVPSGVYFYRLEAGKFEQTKRMVLIK